VKGAKLTPKTEFLEYSAKDVDPATLVTCDDADVKVTADGTVDLSKVGTQEVAYTLVSGDDAATKTAQFTVRDTKAPTISLSNGSPSIEQGQEFNPASAISSVADPVEGELARVTEEPQSEGTIAGLEEFYPAGWYLIDGAVDNAVPGTYSLVVRAADKHGNTASKEILVTVTAPKVEEPAPEPAAATYTYIANTNTGKFHIPSCRDVKKMKESNKLEVAATRQEMIDWGYSPCKHCNP
jgi:hypothetical protein